MAREKLEAGLERLASSARDTINDVIDRASARPKRRSQRSL